MAGARVTVAAGARPRDLQDMGYDESWIAERWPEPDLAERPHGES